MCGIAGIVAAPGVGDITTDIRRMTAAIAYRGPDGDGHWVDADAGIALGHRRLAVIDLSDAGAQPMASHDGRWVLSYNGEIYNYRELQRALERERNIAWRGHSDTEVLLEAIDQWGLPATLERADGMFAIALWDRQRRELHLARDRFGEKPLYVGWNGGRLLFASELKALHAGCSAPRGIDAAGLEWLLALGYIPAPWTPFLQTFKLPAGHWLTLPPGGAAPRDAEAFAEACTPYWSPRASAEAATRLPRIASSEDALAQVEQALEVSIGRRMLADVPLGAFLSGGVDSSLVTALMVKQSPQRVRTFTIGFSESDYDESVHAARVAEALGTEHHMQRLHADDALALVPELPRLFDEPLADASQLPTFLLSRYARRHVTVCLSGDGGDELFFGYQRQFNALALWRTLSRMPRTLRAAGAGALVQLGRWSPAARRQRWRQAGFLRSGSAHELHLAMSRHWSGAGAQPAFLRAAHGPSLGSMENMRLFDQQLYLANDLMAKTDRAAMAVSLETRMPFLEPDLAALSWRLPPSLLYREGQGKWLLRTLLARHVPRDIVERPKQGFGVPLAAWLRAELRVWASELVAYAREHASAYIDVPALQAMWGQHLSGQRDCSDPLWTALTLLNWLRAQDDIVVDA
jgi:asparagine synthase (glutamine-hydrolysing)